MGPVKVQGGNDMEEIVHKGVVQAVENGIAQVLIEQASACSLCHARHLCASSERQEKRVEAHCDGYDTAPGDMVEVYGVASMGLKAVWWAYVAPLLLMLVLLFLCLLWWMPGRELTASLISLGGLALYYTGLSFFSQKLKTRFVFRLRPLAEGEEGGLLCSVD